MTKPKPRATVIHAPHEVPSYDGRPTVFLAGSIEMGVAVDWQASVIKALGDLDCVILNPRRPDWDASWKQVKSDPQFRRQVEWELAGLEAADLILLYLAPETKSPISLLELGLFSTGDKLLVCCPEGFWRKGNVDIVCERYGIPAVATLEALIDAARPMIERAAV